MQLHFPGALGMILSGMLLRNVGGGIVIRGLQASWSKQIRAAALAIIFLRSGLEIDLEVRALVPRLLLQHGVSSLPNERAFSCTFCLSMVNVSLPRASEISAPEL